MSAVRRLLLPALALAVLAATVPVSAAQGAREPETWITIERAVAERASAEFARTGRPALELEGDGNIVATLVREQDMGFLAQTLHEQRHQCGGFIAHLTREAAVEEALRANSPDSGFIPNPPIDYTIDNGPVVQALIAGVQEINVRNTIVSLSNFFTRYHNCPSGLDSANWIRDKWAGYAAGRSDVSIEMFTLQPVAATPQPSVILTITGTTFPSEVVILGGHRDSIAGSNCSNSRSPGADDDASGVASISEVLRVAMALGYRPQRTVKFMAYAGEEVGLRGSANIAQTYVNQGVNVVAAFQLDMTNFKGSTGDIYMYTDHTNATLTAFVTSLIDTYMAGTPRGTSACGYACSDHASWQDRGFPAVFPFEAIFGQHNSTIHTINDTILQSGGNANQALKFSKLGAAYMAEVAKGGFTNQPPMAAAGADQVIHGMNRVTLDGSSSSDPQGSPLTYSWTQVSGPSIVIPDAHSAVAHFRPRPMDATYVLRLTVSNAMAQSTDDVTVRVDRSELP